MEVATDGGRPAQIIGKRQSMVRRPPDVRFPILQLNDPINLQVSRTTAPKSSMSHSDLLSSREPLATFSPPCKASIPVKPLERPHPQRKTPQATLSLTLDHSIYRKNGEFSLPCGIENGRLYRVGRGRGLRWLLRLDWKALRSYCWTVG